MRIRKPLSLSLSFSGWCVHVLIHARPFQTVPDHPSPNVLPFRIGARVSLAIQIHFLHDITGEIYSGWLITVWRDCLHFAATSLKNELGGSAPLVRSLGARVHRTGKVFTGFGRRDGSLDGFKRKTKREGGREGCGASY